MSTLFRELQAIVRRATRRPAFFTLTVALLGVGFGATLLVASLYDQVMFRTLPVPRPEQLALVHKMTVSADGDARPLGRFALSDCGALRRDAAELLDLACFADGEAVVGFEPAAARVKAQWVTADYFPLLGVRPQVGRLFDATAAKDDPGVVLSYGAWQRRFAADPAAIGRRLQVNGRAATVLGVAPSSFRGTEVGDAPELFQLATLAPPGQEMFSAIARLAPGSTLAAAQGRLRVLYRALAEARPRRQSFMVVNGKSSRASERIDVVPGERGDSELRGSFSRSLLLGGGMLALVLLILCFNLANLLATRAAHERRQNAVRRALGATRARLAAAWLGESIALCTAGAGLGLVLAQAAGPAMLAALPEVQAGASLDFNVDFRVLLLALGLSLMTAVLVGSLASWEASRSPLEMVLRGGAPGGRREGERSGWRWAMVGAQVGLSVVLLAGMSLLASSLGRLLRLDTGLPLDRVLSFAVDLQRGDAATSAALLPRLREAVAAVPGVTQVSYSTEQVLDGSSYFSMGAIEGYRPAAGDVMAINTVPVSPGFFETLGLRLLRGRTFAAGEEAASSRAVVVNRAFAQRYLAAGQPLGRRLSFDVKRGDWARPQAEDLEVVGVVADATLAHVKETPTPRVYTLIEADASRAVFYLRSAQPPAALAAAVRNALRSEAKTAALGRFATLAEQRDRLLGREHLLRRFSLALALLGALITAIGLYGVLGLAVARRAKDLAVRLALGARGGQIATLVARQAGGSVVIGIVAGLLAAVPATRLLKGFLYGVEPGDWHALAAAVAALLAVATLACWLPVRRAMRTDPASVLRHD